MAILALALELLLSLVTSSSGQYLPSPTTTQKSPSLPNYDKPGENIECFLHFFSLRFEVILFKLKLLLK